MHLLEADGVSKRYGETQALDNLSMVARSDEVTGIAGPNGAGKSTLIRVLAGEEIPDAGSVALDGQGWDEAVPRELVAVVHQEPKLFPNLTVAENLLVGTATNGIRRPTLADEDLTILEELGIRSRAGRTLSTCSLVTWQLTEIARAIRRNAQVFLFDEPNSALSEDESERLFEHILELRQRDRVVLLVSHRLAELADLCDRVVIVREGRAASVLREHELTEDAIAAELVVGHQSRDESGGGSASLPVPAVDPLDSGEVPAAMDGPSAHDKTEILLRLRDWTHEDGAFEGISLDVQRGQVMSIMGVEGSGGRELIRSIAGLSHATGEMEISPRRPWANADVSYLPADRQTSLFPNFSVGANLVARLGKPEIASRTGRLHTARFRRVVEELMSTYQVKAQSPTQSIGSLSGGNQQKVAVAASIATRPQLLVVEEPTRGVDIGTKSEIYRLLWDFADEGNAVIAFCTEVPEVFDLAEEVRICHLGKLSRPLQVDRFADVTELAEAVTRATRKQEAVAS